jgi:hypothetical protein
MNNAPRPCLFGLFAFGVLVGVAISLATILLTTRSISNGPDAGIEALPIFLTLFLVGPSISAFLAVISLLRHEFPRWPAWVSIGLAAWPVGLYLNHWFYLLRHAT